MSEFCAEMVSMKRKAKIALMVAVDLLALPFCILIAMLLRVGDLSLVMHYGPLSDGPYLSPGCARELAATLLRAARIALPESEPAAAAPL